MAPRSSVRTFPSADQLGLASGAIINQSRITFSGQRGLVWCAWKLDVRLAVGPILLVTADFNASFTPVFGGTGIGHFAGVVGGERMGLWAFALVQDPPENGFIEMRVLLSVANVDVLANQSVSMAMSFEPGVGEGPTVTLG